MQNSEQTHSSTRLYSSYYLFYGFFLVFSVFIALYLIPDGDFWVHLAQGKYIIDHRHIPTVDVFSFTYAGQSWSNWEWLHNVGAALLWEHAGAPGIIGLRFFLTALLGIVMFRLFRRLSASGIVSFAIAFSVLLLIQHRISDRPQMAAYLLTALALHLAATMRDIRSLRFCALFAVWVLFRNIHPSWPLAVVAPLALFADAMLRRERPMRRDELLLLVATLSATFLLTPFPMDISHYLTLQFSSHGLNEWRSFFSLGSLFYSPYYFFFLLFGALLLAAVLLTGRRHPLYSLLVLLLLINAFLHVRFIADTAIVGSLLLARAFPLDRSDSLPGRPKALATLIVFCGALLLGQANLSQLGFHRGVGIDADKVPLYLGEHVRKHDLKGNFFGLHGASTDFLMAYAYPQVKVAVDIRVPGLYPYEFAERYWDINNEADLRKWVLSLPLDYIVLGRSDYLSHQTHEAPVERILRREGWALYYLDRRYALYGRRDPRSASEPIFEQLSRWNLDPRSFAENMSADDFEKLRRELLLLKRYTAGQDDFYRDVLISLYTLPAINDKQKQFLEEMFDKPMR